MSARAPYRALRKKDLGGFDKDATSLILEAMDAGCSGKVSNRGHCILRNSAGGTAAIPKNLTAANRTARNARAQVARLIAAQQLSPE